MEVNIIKSPMFLFDRNDFVSMAKGKKVYRMSSFYEKGRKNMTKDKLKKLETGIEIRLDMLENRVKPVFLAIGSNLGDKKLNIEKAKFKLSSNNNIKILSCSSFYKTLSWPNKKNPFFLNVVIKCNTNLTPRELFKIIKKIERDIGRVPSYRNAPRVCDIDIIDFSQKDKVFKDIDLILPHPRLENRSFVLLPLYEIDKQWCNPLNNKNVVELLSNLPSDTLRTIKFF